MDKLKSIKEIDVKNAYRKGNVITFHSVVRNAMNTVDQLSRDQTTEIDITEPIGWGYEIVIEISPVSIGEKSIGFPHSGEFRASSLGEAKEIIKSRYPHGTARWHDGDTWAMKPVFLREVTVYYNPEWNSGPSRGSWERVA